MRVPARIFPNVRTFSYLKTVTQTSTANTMNEKQNSGNTQQRGNGNAPELNPEHELIYRIKSVIDGQGRYKHRLTDMSAGYAAAQGISNAAARRAIEDRFTAQVGMSPKDYLEHHYEQRRQQSQEASRPRSRQRDRGDDRER